MSNGKKKESGTGGRKSGTAQCFNFRDMAIASRNFRDLIGEGGFGKVYKGRLDSGEVRFIFPHYMYMYMCVYVSCVCMLNFAQNLTFNVEIL